MIRQHHGMLRCCLDRDPAFPLDVPPPRISHSYRCFNVKKLVNNVSLGLVLGLWLGIGSVGFSARLTVLERTIGKGDSVCLSVCPSHL